MRGISIESRPAGRNRAIREALCQRGYDALAARWRSFIAKQTTELSDGLLKELTEREARYGVKLRTVRDRLEERFTRPLEIDRAAAQVAPAAEAARSHLPGRSF